jgi:hypothetical protein
VERTQPLELIYNQISSQRRILELIYNQIFKFCENTAPAGNPNPIRVRGAKKSKVLLRIAQAWSSGRKELLRTWAHGGGQKKIKHFCDSGAAL